MKNELLEKWAEVMGPWYEREKRWLGTPFFTPPAEALAAVADAPLVVTGDDERDRVITPFTSRHDLVMEYAWAVPTDEALEAIARHSPNGVVEIGAGTGYWAGLLRDRGVDVVAYDKAPYDNHHASRKWSEVEVGRPLHVLKHPERTLFLCWPPYANSMAAVCLRRYKGDTVIYIGEDDGGCTADADFHEQLETGWEEIEHVPLPQWPGIHDELYVYRRA